MLAGGKGVTSDLGGVEAQLTSSKAEANRPGFTAALRRKRLRRLMMINSV
ncbi:hypothetical protein L585_10765 [Pantoea ananatis BRT175]|nr:hypothetical protein L585_10765 [Pantoea ananatis BRT175]